MMVGIKAGDVFRLLTNIMSIQSLDGRMGALVIPEGSLIKIVAHPCEEDDRMTDALWDEQSIRVFFHDLEGRARRVSTACA